ncbi:hypothetical protein GCK32_005963, partial [Trichostrongylus colubriformis]
NWEKIAVAVVKLSPTRSESFSSIDSVNTRKKFKLAVENIKRGILCIASNSGKGIKVITIMDSPPDLSPNAPPAGYDDTSNYFANLQAPPAPPSRTSNSTGQESTEGSVDSSGFEKVDHDVLEEYGQQFVNQMQQALFGKLPEEGESAGHLEMDTGFLLVGRQSFRIADQNEIYLLERTRDELDSPPPGSSIWCHGIDRNGDHNDDEAWLSSFS